MADSGMPESQSRRMLLKPKIHVLVVDDDKLVRAALARGLRGHFQVTDVGSVEEAMTLVNGGAAFAAVVTDVEMPTTGQEFVRWLESHAPLLAERTIVISGGPRDPALRAWCATLPRGRFFPKPLRVAVLVSAIEAVATEPPAV